MKTFNQISVFLVIGTLITILSYYLNSDALYKYLVSNIITIQIAVITVTLTVFSFMFPLLLKIARLMKIKNTDKEIKLALKEQCANIFISIILVIVSNSNMLDNLGLWIVYSFLLSSLLFGLWNIWDVGNAVVNMYLSVKRFQEKQDE